MSRVHDLMLTLLAAASILVGSPLALGQLPPPNEPAKLKVFLPADAILHVDGAQTQSTGEIRNFVSPDLPAGKKFVYTLRATWKEGGKVVDRERKVRVEAGQDATVDFREPLPPPEVKDNKNTDAGSAGKPAAADLTEKMLELAEVKNGDVIYDPKCGDGGMLIKATQKYGVKGVGFDSDPQRVNEASANVKKSGLADFVTIKKQDMGEVDLTDASLVVLHPSLDSNSKLMLKLANLKPGSRIVSDNFALKGAKPAKKISFMAKGDKPSEGKEHTLYLWIVPLEKE